MLWDTAARALRGDPQSSSEVSLTSGRAMEIIYSEEELKTYVATAVKVSKAHPILVDKYLSHAIEVDVDVVSDGARARLRRPPE